MIKVIEDNIFNCDADCIVHQVNCMGIMGSGVALQVKTLYPEVYLKYTDYVNSAYDNGVPILGTVLFVQVQENLCIANLFGQYTFGYNGKQYTDYDAFTAGLKTINEKFAGKKVAIPYNIGCCRGGGDWTIVNALIEQYLSACNVTYYKYKG